jgi:hypothetical protein
MSTERQGGPVPPYGIPIRDAIARGYLHEMKALRDSVKPALEELEAAIKKLESSTPLWGSNKPYGPPIRDAIARGDVHEMRALRDSVKPALEELEAALLKLEGKATSEPKA